jgi:hypothetical protein
MRALAKSEIFHPMTPRKTRAIQNVRSHKRYSTWYAANEYELHTPTKRNESPNQDFPLFKEEDVEL